MGLVDAITGPFVYLDANIFIYALEAHADFASELTELFKAIDQGQFLAVTSELTLAETLVKPMLDGDIGKQAVYEQAIQNSTNLHVVSVSRRVLIEAARLRSASNLLLPDAIHAATSLLGACETFLTNDPRFRRVAGLPVVILSEAI